MHKIWILKPASCPFTNRKEIDKWRNTNPWGTFPYGQMHGFVIVASTEGEAREEAHANAGEENDCAACGNYNHCGDIGCNECPNPWLNPKWSTCDELTGEGKRRIIMYEYHQH